MHSAGVELFASSSSWSDSINFRLTSSSQNLSYASAAELSVAADTLGSTCTRPQLPSPVPTGSHAAQRLRSSLNDGVVVVAAVGEVVVLDF